MKSFVFATLLHSLLGSSLVLAAVPLSSIKTLSTNNALTNRVIVEIDTSANNANARAYPRALDAVYDSIRARAGDIEIQTEFNVEGIFVGAALTINTTMDALAVDDMVGVKGIYQVRQYQRSKPVLTQVLNSPEDPAVIPSSKSSHVATGIDKVHAKGFFGKGIKIAIIDSGVDYNHPALGGGFGPGKKIVGGYDLVGDAYDGVNTPVPDADPLDECSGHGTHVAGIVGANPGNPYNVTGAAYEAELLAYRVFGCNGSVTDDVLIEALLRGVKDGADILSLSIGGSNGWTSSAASVVASRIAKRGKIVTISAGNDGDAGMWYTSTPANAIDAISVGSVENAVIPVQKANVIGAEHAPIVYYSSAPLGVAEERPIYALTQDTTIPNDACTPLPDTTPDLSGYIVIVRRGECTFVEKVEAIKAKNATAALIYDNGGGMVPIGVPDFQISMISPEDGQFLVDSFFAQVPLTLAFPQDGASVDVPNIDGGLMSYFSTYGPTNDFHFKPSVSAPGGYVMSTMPLSLGSYAVMSGTSMSAPLVAGAAALLLQVKGKSAATAKAVRNLFETTAVSVPASHEEQSLPQTLTQQGAGLVNVYNAIFAKTLVHPGQLILNETSNFVRRHTFVVRNTDTKLKRYSLSHVPAGTVLTVQENSIMASLGMPEQIAAAATVTLKPSQFTLRPGKQRTITATFTAPQNLDASRYPVYSGFIQVSGPGENYHVSYLGLAASLKDKQVVDNTDLMFNEMLPMLVSFDDQPQREARDYTFTEEDYPTFVFRLVFGSPLVRIDLVAPDIKIATNLHRRGELDERHGKKKNRNGKKKKHDHHFTFPTRHRKGSFTSVKTIGVLSEEKFVSRNDEFPELNGWYTMPFNQPLFADGSVIPNGQYRMLFRALKVTGNPNRQEDYETWLSPIIGINAAAETNVTVV